ncbi:MAG: aspartate aminotransferase family protein [Lachnospiraceae bacterium]|nr:aspartate aminotransferase family protein [Lachnospiraceae bacterium]
MSQSEIISQTEQYVLHTYNRYQVAIESGDGVRIKDTEGNTYLDFMSGIGVYALGYHFPGYDEAVIEQVKKTLHTSNLYYHQPLAEAAKKLVCSCGLSKAFFTNSGAEAIEGAIKAARKYSFSKYGADRCEVIAMKESFHGRTVGALSVTGNDHYQEAFRPLMGGVKFARFNDIDSVREVLNGRTCAIIVETVQGEGGIFPATQEFMSGLREMCSEMDAALILDEVQCGMGRTGSMWAFEQYGLKPDILCTAKALGCGVPVGAFVLNEKFAENSLCPGDHGTTYGGNPLATAAVSAVFDLFEKYDVAGRAKENGAYLAEKLDEIAARHPSVKAHRGMGLIRGLELTGDVQAGKIASEALGKGLFIITAGHNTLRFLPPLIISKEEIDEGLEVLDGLL